MRKKSIFFIASLIFSSSFVMAGAATYAGQTCMSCHEEGGRKSQAPIVNGTGSLSSKNERMSALGIRALAASSASCTASSNSMMHKAFLGYYARCPDEGGLAYWCGQLDTQNGDLSSLIAGFGTSSEYTKRFSGMTDTQLITNLYQNMFNRGTDETGLNFYINLLDQRRKEFSNSHSGNTNGATEYALSRIALDVLNGAVGTDAITLSNKVSACNTMPVVVVGESYNRQIITLSVGQKLIVKLGGPSQPSTYGGPYTYWQLNGNSTTLVMENHSESKSGDIYCIAVVGVTCPTSWHEHEWLFRATSVGKEPLVFTYVKSFPYPPFDKDILKIIQFIVNVQ